MISEVQIQDHQIVDSTNDSLIARVNLTCFIKAKPSVLELTIESPWSEIKFHKIIIKKARILGSEEHLELDYDTEETIKKNIAIYLQSKIK